MKKIISLTGKISLLFTSSSIFYFWGDKSHLLLLITLLLLIFALYLWHSKIEIIRVILSIVIISSIEIYITSQGVYSYASKELFTIPLWLPIGWGFFSLVLFRIVYDILSISHIEIENRASKNRLVLIFEFISIPILIFVSMYIWKETVLCLFLISVLLLLILYIYNSRMSHLIVLVAIPAALVLEYFGIAGKSWSWSASDFLGMPLWVPVTYAYVNLIVHRVSLKISELI